MTEVVTYGRNRDKEVHKGNGGGAEDASKLAASIILGSLEDGEEGGLVNVREPDLGGIGKDGGADGMEDFVPRDKFQASDGISEDTEGSNEAADLVGHGADVESPVQFRGEENPKVAEGLCD